MTKCPVCKRVVEIYTVGTTNGRRKLRCIRPHVVGGNYCTGGNKEVKK